MVPLAVLTLLQEDVWAGLVLFQSAQFWLLRVVVAFWSGGFAGTPAVRLCGIVDSL